MTVPFTYFNRITVSNASFNVTADVTFGFSNPSFSLINEGTGVIEYSFDGSTVHGDLTSSTPSAALIFNQRSFGSVWFRLKSGATSDLRVEAISGTIGISGNAASGGGGGSVTVTNFPAIQPVSGTVTANLGTLNGAATSAKQDTGNTSLSSIDGKTVSVNTGAVTISTALPAGTNVIGHTITDTGSTVSVSNFPITQPVSGTVTANLGTLNGAATSSLQTSGNTSLSSIDGKITAVNTGAVIISSSVLPTSGSTSALQTSGNSSLTSIDSKITAVNTGAVTISTALPTGTNVIGHVIIDSGSTTVVSNFPATQPVSGTITANIGTSGSLALDTTLDNLTIAQGASLGSNTQALMGGSVTTAAPTYVTGQISPLNLTTGGALRTSATATVSGNVTVVGTAATGAAVSGNPIPISGIDGSGNTRPLLTSTTGLLRTAYDYGTAPGIPWASNAFGSLALTGLLVKTGSGVLRWIQFINSTGVSISLQIFDRTTAPSTGNVPLITQLITTGNASTLSLFEGGFPFSTGLYIIGSITIPTYTATISTAITGVVIYA